MDKIELIKQAIEKAENRQSKLTPEILDLPSYSSHKIKHLLNNLGEISKRYLECGIHKSGMFVSAMYKNKMHGFGVDSWCQFEENGVSKKVAYQNVETHLPKYIYAIIEKDIFEITSSEIHSIDLYCYDGNHADWAQKKGITHFYDMMNEEFIFCCDDYDWDAVKKGTQEGIKECGFEVLFEQHLTSGKEGDGENWWNGFYVALLKKPKI